LPPNRSARPRVIRGTRAAPLPLLPSGPGGVCGRPLHGARDLTSIHPSMRSSALHALRLRTHPAQRLSPADRSLTVAALLRLLQGEHGGSNRATFNAQITVGIVGLFGARRTNAMGELSVRISLT
jgi:hypothetical protein